MILKWRSLIVCLAMIVAVLLVSCAPVANTSMPINISCDDFQKQPNIVRDVELTAGSSITVTLCSNKTTGFSWDENAQITDNQVIQQTSYKWVPPAESGKMGAPGNEVWNFKAMKQGKSTISLAYSRPWQGGEKGVNTFKLNITVK